MGVISELNPTLTEEIQRVAQIGYWKYLLDKGELQGSQIIYDIHEVPKGTDITLTDAMNFYHPNSREILESHFQACIEKGIPYDLEVLILTFKKNKKWVRTIGHPKIVDGKVTEVYGVFQDITHKKSLYDEILDSKERMDFILSSIKMGVWEWDCTNNRLHWDDTIFEMIEVMRGEIKSEAELYDKIIHPDDREMVTEAIQESLNKRSEFNLRYRIITPKGNTKYIMARGKVYKRDGITWFTGLSWDVTHETNLQETIKVQQTKIQTSARMASLGEMASGIAHEINNPLSVIQTQADFLKLKLKKHALNEDTIQTGLDKIIETCGRIVKIVKGLRTFSRHAENDPMTLVQLDEVLNDSISLISQKLNYSSIEVSIDKEDNLIVMGRPAQLGQVFLNLLSNSFDAIATLDKKWINIEVKRVGDKVRLRFVDSGTGIMDPHVTHIFQPFYTTKDVGKGTGLGLSISKGIIEEHGGKLHYDHCSKNTTFVIELPAVNS
ncbi:sensor histidine kinase [Peredibacter starrii]|uniref:histidine kinase n=1 Tax=Peredibacter starrii TaxID=28202 RepID=A0AAX4HIZ9_9BACT|nr:ATP-binding protein [Peredibacter starrii]WPU63212.1 PAS domain-containing protein [Peredibacter starrii]